MEKMFPSETVIITDHFDVHQDWNTPIPGLFIIASRRKIESIEEFSSKESDEYMKILIALRKGMRKLLGIEKVIVFQNEYSEWDYHTWVFPFYSWMGGFGHGSRSMKTIVEYSRENMTKPEHFREVKKAVSVMKKYMERELE